MDDIEAAFRQHVSAIQAYRGQDFSEAMTRKFLIDPLLAILGYQSPAELRLEVRVPNTGEFIDYELVVDGKPKAIVEAKALRNDVTEQHAAQCVKYAALLGVQWCLVTNGIVWAIYDAYAPVELVEKRVVEVRLDEAIASVDNAWLVLSEFRQDALRESEPLAEILVERVVAQEFRRLDSKVISALRSAVRARVGHPVSAESVVAALSRMVGAGRSAGQSEGRKANPMPPAGSDQAVEKGGLRQLVDAGLLPPDARLEMKWKGKVVGARVRNGQIEVDGQTFSTPSGAAGHVKNGGATNGWRDWRYNGETLDATRRKLLMSGSESRS